MTTFEQFSVWLSNVFTSKPQEVELEPAKIACLASIYGQFDPDDAIRLKKYEEKVARKIKYSREECDDLACSTNVPRDLVKYLPEIISWLKKSGYKVHDMRETGWTNLVRLDIEWDYDFVNDRVKGTETTATVETNK